MSGLADVDLKTLRQILGEPMGCWVGHDATVHWWRSDAKKGDRCFCGNRILSVNRSHE